MKLFVVILSLAALVAVDVLNAQAVVGTDNASASAYASGWTPGTDGFITGEGAYGQWYLSGTGSNSFTIADVSSLGGSTALNTNGVAFRLFATGAGNQADAYRFIDPNGLGAGQTFSIQLAVNWRNGFKGIDLRGATVGDPTLFNFNVGGDDYVVDKAATGNGSIGNSYSNNSIFTLSFTQIDLNGGAWTIDRSGGVTSSTSGTYTGLARSIKLYTGGTDPSNENALFVNNLATVPEPATFVLLGAAALGFAIRRKLRHQTGV